MSKLADLTFAFFKEWFPHNIILKEHYVRYGYTKLFFDFYIKDLGILIEVQGRQHDKYVEHFHGDKEGFLKSKKRDNLKKEFCEKSELLLIEIRSEKDLTKDNIFNIITNDNLFKR